MKEQMQELNIGKIQLNKLLTQNDFIMILLFSFQITQFTKEELILQFALPPRFIQSPEQYLSEYLLDQMLLKPFEDQKILVAYQIIQINPTAKISPYQPELLVEAQITVLLMDFDQTILAEVVKKTESNVFIKINGILDGKLIIDNQDDIEEYQKEDIIRCQIVNKEIKYNKIYFILKPICKVLAADQELK